MGKFGWAHITDAQKPAKGPDQSLQFASGSLGEISGSSALMYNYNSNFLVLSGNMDISGTLRANVFDVITTTKTEIDISGSTRFGDDSGDTHVFTGSISIVSGGLNQHYSSSASTSYSLNAYDSIVGITSTSYTSLIIPSASVAGPGRTLIIKDESSSTRSEANRIAVSASTGDTIDGQSTYSLSGDNPALTIYSNGVSKWFIY
jgi:hypothetical protein